MLNERRDCISPSALALFASNIERIGACGNICKSDDTYGHFGGLADETFDNVPKRKE
jgi:hypothetical protein